MRILAIRGANLASLAGRFEIDLAQGPLAEAGVFAICGPTGSGKSTLLDAMCLALFDTAPRLSGRSRVRVGRDASDDARITTTDPRSILRKGTGAGFAEVDFRGVDGGTYRARWEVRRARDRPEGKLQPTTLTLEALGTETRWEGRKTDVKAEIERRLGLSFDQFRRSVLLAQGDFAAFLDADPKERADLLERMTGTAIYGVISTEAHARAATEKRGLEQVIAMRDGVEVLRDEARAELAARCEELAIRVRQDELERADAERALRWHHELGALAREEREAGEAKERIERQLALWETRRRELEGFDAVRPLRPLHGRAVDARAAREERARALGEAADALAIAASRRDAAIQADADAARAAQAEERAWESTRAAVARARVLDQQLADAARVRGGARALADGAARDEAELAEALESLEERGLALEAQKRALTGWLDEDPAAPLVLEWPRTEERLAALVSVHAERLRVEAERSALAARLDRAGREEAAATGRWLGFRRTLRELEGAWEEARAEARLEPSDALIGVRERWMSRRTALETLVGVADKAQEAHEAERRHRDRQRQAEEAARRADLAAGSAARQGEAEAARLEELERQRDRVRAALDLSARRAELEAGEPCPLCGSEDHPYAHEAPALDSILADVDARVREVRAALRGFETAAASAVEEGVRWRATASEAGAEASAWREALGRARAAYRAAARDLGGEGQPWPEELPLAPDRSGDVPPRDWGPLFALRDVATRSDQLSAEALSGLAEARDEAAAKLLELEAAERRRRDRERAVDALRARRDEAGRDEAHARAALDAAARRLDAAAHEAAVADKARARVAAEQRRLEGGLAPAIAPWWAREVPLRRASATPGGALQVVASGEPPSSWAERAALDPAGFSERVCAAASARLARSAELASVEAAAAALAPELERARVSVSLARQRSLEAAKAFDAALDAEARLRAAREAALEGDADAVEGRSRSALETRRAEARASSVALTAARAVAVRAVAEHERAAEELRGAETLLRRAEAALTDALRAAGLDREAALARLARDPSEIAVWREDLARLDRERAETESVLAERARKREAHAQTEAPDLDAEAAAIQRTSAERNVERTRELLHAARGRLERDDVDRQRAERLDAELAKARARVEVWLTLSDLIGSATGNKLRVFAQSLTLELVLEHANHHLRDLASRYSLERVAGEDLAIQVVDHSMGDEVRAVGSLSGGESFLVSLGMALGLASLSSERARVDSLFIDEGFGALDAASLETVLSTLDMLQATGRQVGLISHVPMVAERFETRVQVVAAGPARSRVQLIERPS